MAHATLNTVLQHLHRLAGQPAAADLTDRQLLARFAGQRDEAAFAALVRRHGPLVLGVCGRVLPRLEDAEDAFQATFLVLARKAGSAGWHESVGNWLYEVASRLARKARAEDLRRQARERQAAALPPAESMPEAARRELRSVLDEELQTLPEKYRAPLLLCYLEGETRDEAARHLGWSLGTLKRRLERGRNLLRLRLARRGWALSLALPAAVLAPGAAPAVPALLAASTVRAAAGGGLSVRVAALAEGVLSGVVVARLKVAAVLVLVATFLASGAGLMARHARAAKTPQPGEEEVAKAQPVRLDSPQPSAVAARTDVYGDPLPPSALARMGTVRSRHGAGVAAVAFGRDQKTLASGGQDNTARLWDLATGKELRRFEAVRGPAANHAWVESVAVSADGRYLAAGCGNGASDIVLWETATGKETLRLNGPRGGVTGLAFTPDGKTLVSSSSDGSIHLWDLASGKARLEFDENHGWLRCLALSADGTLLASGGDDNTARLWDAATGKKLQTLGGHGGMVVSVAFSPDGRTVASGCWDGSLRLWDVPTGKLLRTCKEHYSAVSALAFVGDGKTLVSGSWDATLRLWDVATGKALRQFTGHHGPVPAVAVSRDGRTLASGGWDATVRLWDMASGRELRPLGGHGHAILLVAVSPDGRTLATAGQALSSASSDGRVRLWNLATGRETRQLQAEPPTCLRSLIFSPDGQTLFSGQENIQMWQVATGKVLRRFRPDQAGLPLALSPDGKVLAGGTYDGSIVLLDPATGKKLRQFKAHKDFVQALAFSLDGHTLASGSQDRTGTILLWDVATGKEVRRLQSVNDLLSSLAFSPDGRTLASAGGNTRNIADSPVQLWDMATGKEVRRLNMTQGGGATRVVFAPDGKSLAGGTGRGILLWETATGKERRRLDGHTGTTWSVAFTPDGRRLASGSSDTTALVWDVTGLLGDGRPPTGKRSEKDLEALWTDLASDDAVRAHQAIWALAFAPGEAVPFLARRLRPVSPADEGQVARLLADLDSKSFAVRKKATAELEGLGEAVGPALRAALGKDRTLEVRQRLEQLVDRLNPQKSPARLRELRAVEVLEQARTPEARGVLKALADGVPEGRLTREAQLSLDRLSKRPPATP